jgi:hypothetical protein
MARTLVSVLGLALVGVLSLSAAVGCSSPPPPVSPDDRPLVLDPPTHDDPSDPPVAAADDSELATRQRALRVFASEQRTVLNRLENQARFVQTRFDRRRVISAVSQCESELARIENDISRLENDHTLTFSDRDERIALAKTDLRRLAVRMSNMENALGER